MFQHRHYSEIAAVLERHKEGEKIKERFAEALADMFDKDNPRFNRERFMSAAAGRAINRKDVR